MKTRAVKDEGLTQRRLQGSHHGGFTLLLGPKDAGSQAPIFISAATPADAVVGWGGCSSELAKAKQELRCHQSPSSKCLHKPSELEEHVLLVHLDAGKLQTIPCLSSGRDLRGKFSPVHECAPVSRSLPAPSLPSHFGDAPLY